MTEKEKQTLEVRCPKCKKKFSYYSSSFRPFCSERCRLIDLGKWLEEDYNFSSETDQYHVEDNGEDE